MKNIWKLFVGDVRRLTSNIVSIIIVTGLVVIPGLFSWFNISASWNPFANTGNLKFAVANDDEGYKSDLIPVPSSQHLARQRPDGLDLHHQKRGHRRHQIRQILCGSGDSEGFQHPHDDVLHRRRRPCHAHLLQQREEERTRPKDHRPRSRHRGSADQRNVLRNVDEHRAQHHLAADRNRRPRSPTSATTWAISRTRSPTRHPR